MAQPSQPSGAEPFRLMDLPPAVRLLVWAFAAGLEDPAENFFLPQTIQIHFRSRLVFEGARGIPGTPNRILPARLHYHFEVTSKHHMQAQSNNINCETRSSFLLRYPNVIHLPNMDPFGPSTQIIRFNAAVDTIFMDVPSLLALYDYSRPIWNQNLHGEGPSRRRLDGIDLIQRLATPHADNTIQGIDWLRANFLTGLQGPPTQDLTFPPNIVGHWAHEVRIDRELGLWSPMGGRMSTIHSAFRNELYPLWQDVRGRRRISILEFFVRTGPGVPLNTPDGFFEDFALI